MKFEVRDKGSVTAQWVVGPSLTPGTQVLEGRTAVL